MAIDLWNDDDEEFSGEYVQEGGGDFPVIPHDTRVLALIDKAEWDCKKNFKNNEKEENCISLRFEIDDGEYKGQKIFKKFFIESENEDQARKDYSMFLNIDANAGGKIRALRRKPENEDLQRYLINKQMVIVIGMMEGKDGKKSMNYLMGVSSGSKKPETKREEALKSRPAPQRPKAEAIDEDDIPF